MTSTDFAFYNAKTAIDELHANKDRVDLDFVAEMLVAGDFVVQLGTLPDVIETGDMIRRFQYQSAGCTAWGFLTHWSYERGDVEQRQPDTFDEHCQTCPRCAYLEAILGISSSLESKGCGDCRGGAADHVYSPGTTEDGALDWFNASVWCEEPWRRVEPLVIAAGKIAPYQTSEAFSARWVAPLVNGTWAALTRTYYLGYEAELGTFLERDDLYLICADPDDPDGTAIESAGGCDVVESDDPDSEDLHALAAQSPAPEPGEYVCYLPHAVKFLRD